MGRYLLQSLMFSFLVLAPQVIFAAGGSSNSKVIDLTKNNQIPPRGSHTWNLGPTGAEGWMHSSKLVTSNARQILVTKVTDETPADGVLQQGDVILGVGDSLFSYDPRTEFGKAITNAETKAGAGKLHLTIFRDGNQKKVLLQLPVLGSYSDTAPYDCEKSRLLLEKGCAQLALKVSSPNYRSNTIPRCLNALALLASGNDDYLPIIRKEAEWASQYRSESFQTWYYGYVIMFLSEYMISTGDTSVRPAIERLALEASTGQSIVGSWGHKFAQDDGRLGGYGMMNSPGLTLTISLILARKAGVDDPRLDLAIEKSTRLIRFYIGKGAIPYGDHHPWIQTHEDNGKCGMAAVMFNLLKDEEGTEFFSKMSLASHGSERDTGHTGNYFNMLWALPGVSQSGPQATGAWMKEFGGWYLDFARKPDHSFIHQGPPADKNDRYGSWDSSGAYLLALALPLKKIYLTGKQASIVSELNTKVSQQIIADGKGWSNQDRNSYYDSLSTEELLASLSSWSPTVRERSAMALSRRKDDISESLIKKLQSNDLFSQYGACQAIKFQKTRAEATIDPLLKTLAHEDLWLRVLSAEALAAIGESAKLATPALLKRLANPSDSNDLRKMEHRYLCFTLFSSRSKLLSSVIKVIDHDLLFAAVRNGLVNEDGRARSSVTSVYHQLSYDEIRPLLPAIHKAIVEPAPSGIMFASGVRVNGVELLAKHRIQEGIPLCLSVMEIDKWGKKNRIGKCLKALSQYGSAAKIVLPELIELEKNLSSHREAKGLKKELEQVQKIIQNIQDDQKPVELRSLTLN